MRTSGVSSVRQRAGVEVAGTWTFGRDVQRLHTFADEAQRPGQRARERAECAQLRDVVDERRCRPMVEGALPCRGMSDKRDSGFDNGLQRDPTVMADGRWLMEIGRGFGNRSHEPGDPGEDARREVGLCPCIRAVFV